MIEKSPLCPERVRTITGSFAFLEHRFLRDGFWATLSQHALLLYVFLVLVADRKGLSYYSFDKICSNSRSKVCVKYAGPMELWHNALVTACVGQSRRRLRQCCASYGQA